MYKSSQALQDSIDTMARAVKPGGWVIAVEPKMGVEFENKPCDLFNGELSMPVPMNKCKDISKYFEAAGLVRSKLDDAPECSYCYRKA